MNQIDSITHTITNLIDEAGVELPREYDALVIRVCQALETRERSIRANLYNYATDAGVSGYRANGVMTDAGLTDSLPEPVATVASSSEDSTYDRLIAELNSLSEKFNTAVDSLRSQFTR